jgi:hypothetical protein
LKSTQLNGLTTAQVASLSTTQLSNLKSSQISGLSTTAVNALSTATIGAMTTSQVRALTTAQMQSLTTATVSSLSTAFLNVLTSRQLCILTTTQVAALTTAQIAAIPTANLTPMALDLNGDGVQTLGLTSGVKFDLGATGNNALVGWVSGNDGLLARDLNGDGQINDGSELFGSATQLTSGGKAADGYVALSKLDSNQDGKITQADAGFNSLNVWQDANSDGQTQQGELKSLSSLGITELNLDAQATGTSNNGNVIGLESSYQTQDGQTHAMADVWLVTTDDALRNNVSNLAAALSAYQTEMAAGGETKTQATPSLVTGQVAGSTTASAPVSGLVSSLQQFNANGQPTTTATQLANGTTAKSTASQLLNNAKDDGLLGSNGSG